jgi:CheY-like chemotaxis protein
MATVPLLAAENDRLRRGNCGSRGKLRTASRLSAEPSVCILLVEDEPLIRTMLAQKLGEAGFPVLEAETGDEAAEFIRSDDERFTLLVTDIHMPGELNGVDVARLMRAQRPEVPVVYTTGRPEVLAEAGALGANQVVLEKPFSPLELLRIVRRLLPNF